MLLLRRWSPSGLTRSLCALLILTCLSACTSFRTIPEGSEARLTSIYDHSDRTVRDFQVDSITAAPLQIVVMAQIELAPEEVFKLTMSGFEEWVTQLSDVTYDNSGSDQEEEVGGGSRRRSRFEGQRLVERIQFWDPPFAYGYSIQFDESSLTLPAKNHLGLFLVEPSEDGSLLTWREYYDKTGGLVAFFVNSYLGNRIMRPALDRVTKAYGGVLIDPEGW